MTIYAKFETKAVRDRKQEIELGGTRYRDADFATLQSSGDQYTNVIHEITPDMLERWGESAEHKHLPKAYMAWKEGRESPVSGIPLKEWPNITPTDIERSLALNIRTVEDWADAPQSALEAFGSGAQGYKSKAQAYLQAASSHGRIAETITAMQAQMEMMQAQLAEANTRNANKDAILAELLPAEKKGKKKQAEEPAAA